MGNGEPIQGDDSGRGRSKAGFQRRAPRGRWPWQREMLHAALKGGVAMGTGRGVSMGAGEVILMACMGGEGEETEARW